MRCVPQTQRPRRATSQLTEKKDHSGHSHELEPSADLRLVSIALSLIVLLLVVEVVAAVNGNSLVLYADAGHMVTDVAALSLSIWAIKMAQRPPRERWTYGFKRAEILAAEFGTNTGRFSVVSSPTTTSKKSARWLIW